MTAAKARIVDSGTANIDRLLASLKGASVTVGIHEKEGSAAKREAVGNSKKAKAVVGSETLAEVATKHELGIGVPQRSFLGAWVDENEPKVKEQLKRVALEAARRGRPVGFGLMRLGAWSAGQIKRRIIAGIAPELSERRKREKAALGATRKDTPLIFTAQLLSSIMAREEEKK